MAEDLAPDLDDPGPGSSVRGPRTMIDRGRLNRENHRSLKDIAADFIREAIVSGRFGPGSKIDQDEVAETLGISRLPIREALIELGEKGFVAALPRRGAFVVGLTVEDIDDHFEVLGVLFGLTARRAAKELGPAQLAELRSIHDEIDATTDHATHEVLNHEFYRTINQVGSSARLLSTLRFLSRALPGDYYLAAPAWASTEARYRVRLLEALEAHDAPAAVRVTEEHFHACGKVVVDELRARGYWAADAEVDATVASPVGT
jgi:DNA-binding GntR family transcriptional regulator